MILEQIFYSQIFRIFLVLLMGIGGFIYFELVKGLGFKGKYALILGLSLLFLAVLTTSATYSFDDVFSVVTLSQKTSFGIEKLLFGGHAFTIYASLVFLKERLNTRRESDYDK